MKEKENDETHENFIGYEEARIIRESGEAISGTNQEVKAATKRINPDGNTQERG